MVKTLRDQLLAGPPLADHQNRPVERRSATRAFDRVEERQALADELVRALQKDSSKIWPTVGGKSHHLARIFTELRGAKHQFSQDSALCRTLARLLYGKGQVRALFFECGVRE
jgi:hypothetical protein